MLSREYSFNSGIKELVKFLVALRRRILIIVAGGSCSGKTLFARKLEAQLRRNSVFISIIEQDGYFRDFDDPDLPRDEQGRILFDIPGCFHQDEFIKDVNSLLGGSNIEAPCYDKPANKRLEQRKTILARQFVLAEGLFTISELDGIGSHVLKIYVDADEQIRLERRIKRDSVLFDVPENVVEQAFQLKVAPYHNRFVEPQKNQADILIRNNE